MKKMLVMLTIGRIREHEIHAPLKLNDLRNPVLFSAPISLKHSNYSISVASVCTDDVSCIGFAVCIHVLSSASRKGGGGGWYKKSIRS